MKHQTARAAAALLFSALALCPAAAQTLCAGPDGIVGGALTLSALSAPERRLAEERFAPDFAEADSLGLAQDALFAFARCELNGVAPPELIALGRAGAHCTPANGAPRCGLWVLARTDDGWVEVLETVGDAQIAASTSHGWADIVITGGARPLVQKFTGEAYGADTGAAALAPGALDAYETPIDAALEIAWLSVRDPMPRDAEHVFAWFWESEILGAPGALTALPDDFRIGLLPIAPDAAPAVVIQGASAQFCAVTGCAHWIYRANPRGAPTEIARLEGHDIAVAATGAHGRRDLLVSARGGPQVWRHDGQAYARALLVPPAREIAGD
jgi:hypothetical protein